MSLMLRLMLFVAIGLLAWRLLRHLLRPLEPHEQDPDSLGESVDCPGCGQTVPRHQLTGEPPRCERCRTDHPAH